MRMMMGWLPEVGGRARKASPPLLSVTLRFSTLLVSISASMALGPPQRLHLVHVPFVRIPDGDLASGDVFQPLAGQGELHIVEEPHLIEVLGNVAHRLS